MLALTAISVLLHFIEIIGKIMNSEHPDLCTGQKELENHGAAKMEEAVSWFDCCVFSSFIQLHFVRFFSIYESKLQYGEGRTGKHTLSRSIDM